MRKIALVLHRAAGLSREEFLEAYRAAHAGGSKVGSAPPYTIHLAHESDALRADAAGQKPQPARCDGLSFLWVEKESTAFTTPELGNAIGRTDLYELDEVVHWDELEGRSPGRTSPGIKMIAFVRKLPELSGEQFRAGYLEHASVAREHHPGIAR